MSKVMLIIFLLGLITGVIVFTDIYISKEPIPNNVERVYVATIWGCLKTEHTLDSWNKNENLLRSLGQDPKDHMGVRCEVTR